MGIDRGESDTANALEVPGGRSVPVLHVQIDPGQGQQDQQQPGQGVHCHRQGAEHPEEVGEEDVQDERQVVVNGGEVAGEPVENLTDRSGVEEHNLPSDDTFQKLLMNCPGRNDPSESEEKGSHERE